MKRCVSYIDSILWEYSAARDMLIEDLTAKHWGSLVLKGEAAKLRRELGDDIEAAISRIYAEGSMSTMPIDRRAKMRYATHLAKSKSALLDANFLHSVSQYMRAREIFVERNQRLMHSVKWRYSKGDEQLGLELEAVGLEALMTAAELFDGRNKFSTYATWWIKSRFQRHMQTRNTVHIPVHVQEMYSKIVRLQYSLIDDNGMIDVDAICSMLEISKSDYAGVLKAHRSQVSLNAHIDQEGHEMHELVASTQKSPLQIAQEQEEVLQEIPGFKHLTHREREIITLRYGLGKSAQYSLQETAQFMNLDRVRIRQIESKALMKMKKYASISLLA